MPPVPSASGSRRRSAKLVLLAVAAAGLVGLAGCDVNENADTERGRALFTAKCGQCHALAEAGTGGPVGPDLDAAFADARASGMDNDTIEGVVQSQIANPRTVNENDPDYLKTFMPADLVTGQDAEDVATYVASVAGVPGAQPPEAPGGPGGQVFADNGCGACHTLEAAGTGGTSGPNLDETLPGQSAKEVEQSIVDPDAKLAQGFGAGIMPATFGDMIDAKDLQLLVEFLLDSAGQGD
jgi:mono/diheme cytochrome c family protein